MTGGCGYPLHEEVRGTWKTRSTVTYWLLLAKAAPLRCAETPVPPSYLFCSPAERHDQPIRVFAASLHGMYFRATATTPSGKSLHYFANRSACRQLQPRTRPLRPVQPSTVRPARPRPCFPIVHFCARLSGLDQGTYTSEGGNGTESLWIPTLPHLPRRVCKESFPRPWFLLFFSLFFFFFSSLSSIKHSLHFPPAAYLPLVLL